MNTQRTLSKKDRMVLKSYESVLEGLAEFLGSSFEFVLHSLEDLDCAAVKVINGYHSGRKEGSAHYRFCPADAGGDPAQQGRT